jgi:hypothetical protein
MCLILQPLYLRLMPRWQAPSPVIGLQLQTLCVLAPTLLALPHMQILTPLARHWMCILLLLVLPRLQ